MAKLNGVKTLDMVNGEITKVAYNGEEYAKVDKYEGLQKGDIFLAGPHTKFLGNMDTQGYYELIGVQSDGDPIFEDDRGNVRKPGMGAVGVLYRKISASTSPTIEKRVDELESRVSALEGDKAETNRLTIGDIAKVVNKQYGHNAKVGDIVKIVDDKKDIQPYLCEFLDGSNAGWFGEEELIRYNDADIIEFEGAKYRKVDREAREGDVVIFKEGIKPVNWITVGKPYKAAKGVNDCEGGEFIGDEFGEFTIYRNDNFNRTPETVDVYEPIAVEKLKATKSYEPKVGDIVVITGDSEIAHVENEIGDIGKITKVDNDETAKVHVAGKRNEFNYVGFEDMRPATAEEIAQYEKAVADAEKRKAEEAKWAKLGRKVNEYKKGDVVRIIKATVSKNDGEYGTVEDVREDAIGVRLGDGDYRGVYFDEGNIAQLIAPVESVLTHN